MATNGFMAGTSTTTAMSGRTLGESAILALCVQHNDDNLTDAWNKCKPDDEWHASHWKTSSWSSSHWETSGWNDTDECINDRKEQMRSSHSFFEIKSMSQLISSLCRGNDIATFSGIEVDPGESLADTAAPLHRVESSMSALFERPKKLFSTSLDSNRVSSLATTKQWALEAEPRCWERLRCPPAWEVSTV